MSLNTLFFCRKNSSASCEIAAIPLLRFFAVLIIIVPLVISPAASASETTYAGSGGLQTTPSWFWTSTANSLFPGTEAEPLSSGNIVTIDYPAGGMMTKPYFVFGGLSKQEDAVSNEVKLINGSVDWLVFGGYSNEGNTKYNAVTISGGKVSGEVYGGRSYSNGNAEYNAVTINGGEVALTVYGGQGANGAKYNSVVINGGYMSWYVVGGYSDNASIEYNAVTVNGGSMALSIYGGQSSKANATYNSVTINSGNVGWNVYGGSNLSNGNAEYNTVTISGGKIGGNVYGGAAYGNAMYNTATISGGDVSGSVWGGHSRNGDAINNTVTIMGTPTLTTANIFGGYSGSVTGNVITGNTLNFKSSNISAAGVGNFEYYNFYLPQGTAANDTMLSITNPLDLGGTTVEVYLQGGNILQEGDRVALISSTGVVSASPNNSSSQVSQGAFLNYNFDIYTDTNNLWARLTSISTTSNSKALTNSRTAPLAFINQGADLAASLEHLEVSDDSRYTAFAIVGGGSSSYSTGSDVDIDGFSLLAGVTWNVPVKKNSLALSTFIEAGWGSYDTTNDFSGGAVRGDGDTDYFGGGLHMRYKWDSDTPGGLYAEGALRFGRASTDFNSYDLVSGTAFSYDSDSNYYGASAGLGYVWQLSGKTRLDVSGKYLWTRLDSDETTASSGDGINFDSANSHRFRAGFRFYHDYGDAVTIYYGAAYEYEFDGDANGRLYGTYALDGSSLSGGSGIGELGVIFRPSKDSDRLTMQLGVQGYVGVREGISGTLKLQYAF